MNKENESMILPPEDLSNEAVARRLVEATQQRLQAGTINKPNLVWLELNGCSGNIISLLNGTNPNFEYLINSMVNLIYSNSLMVAEGEAAIEKLRAVQEEEYILAVEGAVSLRDEGRYHVIGRWQDREITGLDAARILGEKARHVIAVGACATHGGPSAAKPNLAQCVGLGSVLQRKVIQLPSCPCHPDWFLGTLAHLLMAGEPALDERGRPLLFYGNLIHDRCPRLDYFNRGIFAKTLDEPYCLYQLGCRGPVTRIDCPTRKWNGYVNWPIGASTCIGCSQFGFPDQMAPFVSFEMVKEGVHGEAGSD